MENLFSPRRVDPRRWVLAAVLTAISAALIVGGIELAALRGSIYYLIVGIAVAGSAYFIACGDARGRYLYAATLIATCIWALWESGFDAWGLQARVLAPAALGIWIFWPVLRRRRRMLAGAAVLAGCALVWLFMGGADSVKKPSAPAWSVESGRGDWLHYGNDLAGTRYSPVAQITPDNVWRLKEAWRIRTGVPQGMGFEATPLFVKDTLYLCSPTSEIIALDPDTGTRRWIFDSKSDVPLAAAFCRGLAYYAVPNVSGPCAERIIMTTVDARLIAVDARNGTACTDFGDDGMVDLKLGLGPVFKGYWHTTSAPEVIRGNIIFGAFVLDNQFVGEPSGVIRAYDAVTGRLAWAWDMDHPDRKGEPPQGEIYSPGTPNSWAPLSGDEALGLVYVPLGSPTPDYWGGKRSPASEKFANSIVALDASTGEVRWSFQTTHHDLWDYDVASQPTLVDLPINKQIVPALIQPTKRGQMFLLDRRDGAPLAQVEERPVPQGAAGGDHLSPTQPFSTGMPAFDNTVLSERIMWGMTPLDQLWCRIKFREARYDGPMTPPGIKPSITYPSFSGGIDWGGVSVNPERRLMVVNWLRVPNYTQLIPRAEADAMGVRVPKNGEFLDYRLPMPQAGTPFAVTTHPFWSPLMVPCTEPPFGKIAVVDLDQRKTVWEHPLGNTADSGPFNVSSHIPLPMGVPNIGGTLTTRSGLIFVSATQEQALRAFDIRDGRKLWSVRLPAGGQATPMTFISPRTGKQYVVLTVGGNFGLMTKMGDYVIAYALP